MSLFGIFPGDRTNLTSEQSDGKDVNMQNQKLPFELIIIAVISFIVYLISASLGTCVCFNTKTIFSDKTSAKTLRATFTSLLGIGVLLPILYFMYYFTKTSNNAEADLKNSKKSLIIIAFICYTLMVLSASLGIWLSTCHITETGSSSNKPDAFEISFIIILILAIMLPIFYAVFYFRNEICKEWMKQK
jgi:magnesium-transporting ATPase (P-type)